MTWGTCYERGHVHDCHTARSNSGIESAGPETDKGNIQLSKYCCSCTCRF